MTPQLRRNTSIEVYGRIDSRVPMKYVCRLYYLSTYWYTYGMIIMIKSDKNLYEVIWYVHNKMLYSHIYTSIYDVREQMILPNHGLVHIWDENDDLILLPYVSTLYDINVK